MMVPVDDGSRLKAKTHHQIFRCSHCRALAVNGGENWVPPSKCGKCKL